MTQILPNLFVSGLEESFDLNFLEKNKISHILNVAEEIELTGRIEKNYKKYGIPDDCDSADITFILDDCIKFIIDAHQSHGNVLIHCLEGKSRSVCVIIAYLVKILKWDFDNAINRLFELRNEIDPFPLYLDQTRKWTKINN